MRLTTLHAHGLKSLRHAQLDIPELLVLSGPTGSGKTSLMQAIRLAVLGYEPTVGKQLQATRLLAGADDDIEIALGFESGFGIRRSFGKSLDTKVLPPLGERKDAEKQARIDEETGGFVMAFDLDSFLSLSAEKRKASLFRVLPRRATGLDVEMFRHWLGFAESDEQIKRAIDRLWTEKVLKDESPIDGLASAIAFAHEHQLKAENERQAQVTITDEAEKQAKLLSAVVVAEPASIEPLQTELDTVQRAIGEIRERETQRVRQLQNAQARDRRLSAIATRRDQLDLRRGETAGEIEKHGAPVNLEELSQAYDYAERKARAQRDAVQYSIEHREAARVHAADLADRIRKLTGHSACPLCGTTGDFAQVVESLEELRQSALGVLEEADKEQRAATEQQATLDSAAADRRRALNDATTAANLQHVLHTRAASIAQELAGLEEEESRLRAETDANLPEVDVIHLDGLTRRAVAYRTDISALHESMKAAGKAEAERERADKARAELKARTDKALALKELYGKLLRLRAHVIREMVGPVERSANELLQIIDPAKTFRFIFERENRDEFDFGFEESGKFRSYDAASTGEDAFLAVVLMAALVDAVSPPWRALIIDNMERVDDELRARLLVALEKVHDRFDNIIVAGCCEFGHDFSTDGWTHIDVRDLQRPVKAVA